MERIFGNSSTPNPANWKPEPLERGTYSILSTCIITLGLCVWTAIHLNVPAHGGYWPQIRRKIGWMILGFLAPELVAFAAFQQFTVAKSITSKMDNLMKEPRVDVEMPEAASSEPQEDSPTRKLSPQDPLRGTNRSTPAAKRKLEWTFVHSYFAAMGGFALEIQDGERNFFPMKGSSKGRPTRLTISDKGLLFLEERCPGTIPNIPRARIEDKSKGSILAKSLVCFQATWFCVQCVSRLGQRLPISLLELNTFGHALCTLLIYCMWWYKPLDIEVPELIPVQGVDMERLVAAMCVTSKVEMDPQEQDPNGLTFSVEWNHERQKGSIRKGYFSSRHKTDVFTPIPRLWGRMFPRNSIGLRLRIFPNADPDRSAPKAHGPTNASHKIPVGQFLPGVKLIYDETDVLGAENELVQRPPHIIVPHLDLWRWILAVGVTEEVPPNSLADRTRNFPRFDQPLKQWPLYLAFGVLGLVYGGLHCVAWDAPFSTNLERVLWRVSSVAVTSTGAVIALGFTWALSQPFWWDWNQAFKDVDRLLGRAATKIGLIAALDNNYKKAIELPFRWRIFALPTVIAGAAIGLIVAVFAFTLRVLFDLVITASILLYTVARVYLVVECFINIAHLPDGAYRVPQWAQYVPHIA